MSDRIKPYGGSSRARLTKLLNQTNSTDYVDGVDFGYGAPVEELRERTNTSVEITPLREGFRTQKVNYRRLSISALAALPPTEVWPVSVTTWPFSVRANLARINQALGLNLTPEEVHDDVYFDEGQNRLELRITGTSYAWIRSSYLFKITRDTPLYEVWTSTILNGLHPPAKNV